MCCYNAVLLGRSMSSTSSLNSPAYLEAPVVLLFNFYRPTKLRLGSGKRVSWILISASIPLLTLPLIAPAPLRCILWNHNIYYSAVSRYLLCYWLCALINQRFKYLTQSFSQSLVLSLFLVVIRFRNLPIFWPLPHLSWQPTPVVMLAINNKYSTSKISYFLSPIHYIILFL